MNKILATRYADQVLKAALSDDTKYKTWRTVWMALAESQKELGVDISDKDINAARYTIEDIDYDRVAEIERETRHDVIAHLKHWAEITPAVGKIMHLGATSCFVTDNADIMIQRFALNHILMEIRELGRELCGAARKFASIPCVGYTHFQPAQPTTVGKRLSIWIRDIYEDYVEIVHWNRECRGVKGTTGTQASMLHLFDGDHELVKKLDALVSEKLGFTMKYGSVPVTGQTAPRRDEVYMCDFLSRIAMTLNKMGNDLRLMAHTGLLREEFGDGQIGSSAMPYKKNPMLAERLCSLSRMVPQYRNMMVETAATQWLERSLDDSALRRIVLTDIFLAMSGALRTATKIAKRLGVDARISIKQLNEYRGYFYSEFIILDAVKSGYDRQEIHEILRKYMTLTVNSDHFVQVIKRDKILGQFVKNYTDEQLIGRASKQVVEYLDRVGHWFR